MLLILRKIKRDLFANKQFSNYLLYAIGELLLIIVGILIALQIDQWNTEVKQEESLKSHLAKIARDIGNDLKAARSISDSRADTYLVAAQLEFGIMGRPSFELAEIYFFNYALNRLRELLLFNPTTSSYEALKSSEIADRLHDRDIEYLLHEYYQTAGRIRQDELSHNGFVNQFWFQILANWPAGLALFELDDPHALTAERFQAIQPQYHSVVNSPHSESLVRQARSTGLLLGQYDKLEILGKAFMLMVENDTMNFDDKTRSTIDSIYDPSTGIGYPTIIENGRISWSSYLLSMGDSTLANEFGYTGGSDDDEESQKRIAGLGFLDHADDHLRISYPGGADWAGIWILAAGSSKTSVPTLDFSGFDKLQLELKADQAGEQIILNIEDKDDPLDGTSIRIKLPITDQWQTYEIDLTEFKTADLTILKSALGFIFLGDDPQSFSVRNVRYLQSDQPAEGTGQVR